MTQPSAYFMFIGQINLSFFSFFNLFLVWLVFGVFAALLRGCSAAPASVSISWSEQAQPGELGSNFPNYSSRDRKPLDTSASAVQGKGPISKGTQEQ